MLTIFVLFAGIGPFGSKKSYVFIKSFDADRFIGVYDESARFYIFRIGLFDCSS